jgi:hypothetical protein
MGPVNQNMNAPTGLEGSSNRISQDVRKIDLVRKNVRNILSSKKMIEKLNVT